MVGWVGCLLVADVKFDVLDGLCGMMCAGWCGVCGVMCAGWCGECGEMVH